MGNPPAAGASQPLGGNLGFQAPAPYNLSYDENGLSSPYDSQRVSRAGFSAGSGST